MRHTATATFFTFFFSEFMAKHVILARTYIWTHPQVLVELGLSPARDGCVQKGHIYVVGGVRIPPVEGVLMTF